MAEALGAGLLAATVLGSVHASAGMADGNGVLVLVPPSLAVGAMLCILITILSPVSGGHVSPAVTLLFRLRGEISTRAALAHVLAQCLGAALGVLVFHAMFGLPLIQTATTVRSGAGMWLSEALATATLVLVISGGLAARPALVPGLVGLFAMAGYWFTASTGFTNPAVTLVRMLTDTAGGMRAGDIPAYIAAQLLAVLVATPVANWLFTPPGQPRG